VRKSSLWILFLIAGINSALTVPTAFAQSAPDAVFSVSRVGIGSQLPATGWNDSNSGSNWQQQLSGSASGNSANMSATMSLNGNSQYFDLSANYLVTVYVRGSATSTITSSGTINASATSDGIPRATAGGGAIPFSGESAGAVKEFGAPGSDTESSGGGGSHFSNIGCGGAGGGGSISFPEYPGVVFNIPPGGKDLPFGAGIRNDGPTASNVSLNSSITVSLGVVLGADAPVAVIDGPYVSGQSGVQGQIKKGVSTTLHNHSFDPDNQSGSDPLTGICSTVWEITDPAGNTTTQTNNATLTFTPTMWGNWVVKMTVTDNEGDTAEKTVPMTADPKKARPGNDGREKLGLSCEGGGFDASLSVDSGNLQATWFDPVSTRGFPLEVNIHLNTQSSFPNRVTELGNASFTYGIAIDTAEIEGIAHWFVIDADGEELNFGPASSAPTATAGIFSQLNQVGGGFELLNAGPPESIEVYGNYNYTFDSAGRLTTVVDPSGNIQSVTRDGSGNILSVLDQSSGKTIEFEYDSPGVMARIVEGNGEAVTHFSQSSGRIDVITLRDSLGNNIRQVVFTYDVTTGLLGSVFKDSAQLFSLSYQHVGDDIHLAHFHRPNGGGSNLDYFVVPPAGIAARVNRETTEGGIINYDFGSNGELLKTTLPKFAGATIAPVLTYGYNANRQLSSWSNGITNKTFTYDTLGRLTNSTVSAGQSMVFTYSGANLLTASDQNGTIGTFAYSDSNNPNSPTGYTDAGGNTWTFTYNQYGQLLSSTPPTGSQEGQSSYVYNETSGSPNFGYLEAAIDGSGNTVAFAAYTALGDVGSITTEPQLGVTETTTYDYDPQRRVTEITHPDLKQQSLTYSGHYLESSLDENANVTTFDFCRDCGALEGVSQPLGKSLNWSYGEGYELLGFTDANSNETSYEYGKSGELKKETYPDTQFVSYAYDRYGRAEKRTDSSTRQHTYTYTNTGRLTRVAMNNPWQSASSYYYHPDGRYSSLDDEAGVTTYTYNASRRLSKASYNFSRTGLSRIQDVDYTYFPDGRTQTMTWKDNGTAVVVWTYAYDASGQVSSITDSLGATVSYAYDGEGKILTQTNSNGTSSEYSYYEPRNWVSSIVHKNGGTPFRSFTMEFDGGANTVGNITKVTELDGSQVVYTYDDLYRLTSETRTGTNPFSRSYGYDLAGNITTIDGNAFATYDAGNKLATVTGGSTASDGIGNLTSVSGTGLTAATYTWNSLSNLRTQNAGSGNTTYYYNALQLRVHKRPPTGGGAAYRWYVFDQNNR
jgi:YD repeat-containing protein